MLVPHVPCQNNEDFGNQKSLVFAISSNQIPPDPAYDYCRSRPTTMMVVWNANDDKTVEDRITDYGSWG